MIKNKIKNPIKYVQPMTDDAMEIQLTITN